MSNEQLFERAVRAISDLFSDQSVSVEQAKRSLLSLREEIDMLSDLLKERKANSDRWAGKSR